MTREEAIKDIQDNILPVVGGKSLVMGRLDDAIASTAYILDSLMALRNIYESGCCNDCTIKKTCKYAPKAGQLVRYNCPFYERREE